jgi:hypothetical protein
MIKKEGLLSLSTLITALALALVTCTDVVYADVVAWPKEKLVLAMVLLALKFYGIPIGIIVLVSFLLLRYVKKQYAAERRRTVGQDADR